MSEESPRPLELDWSEEEIIDALSDEVVVLADIESESAGHDTKSSIEAALDQVGDQDPSFALWLSDTTNRQRVTEAAQQKIDTRL